MIEKITDLFYNIKNTVKNFWFYGKTISNDRWYDYTFLLQIIDKKLEQMELNWIKNTHYVGARFTKGRIIILRKYLKELIEDDFTHYEWFIYNLKYHDTDEEITDFKPFTESQSKEIRKISELHSERKKICKRKFFRYLERNYERLWD